MCLFTSMVGYDIFFYCIVENNAILNGGGISLSQSNTLSVTDGIFQGNVAFLGAGKSSGEAF